jgi:hypothetical protein
MPGNAFLGKPAANTHNEDNLSGVRDNLKCLNPLLC